MAYYSMAVAAGLPASISPSVTLGLLLHGVVILKCLIRLQLAPSAIAAARPAGTATAAAVAMSATMAHAGELLGAGSGLAMAKLGRVGSCVPHR